MYSGATGVQKRRVANSGEISAGDSRLRESGDVNPVLNHLRRDEFGITFLGERKHIPGGHTKRLSSRWYG